MTQTSTIPVVGTFAFEEHDGNMFKIMTLEAMNLSDKLKSSLDDIAAGVGCNPDELYQIVWQVKLSGVCDICEIRQMAGLGIPVYAQLGKLFALPVSEIKTLADNRCIYFIDLEKAISRMTSEGGIFFGLGKRKY
jgi:hypothetical protein